MQSQSSRKLTAVGYVRVSHTGKPTTAYPLTNRNAKCGHT